MLKTWDVGRWVVKLEADVDLAFWGLAFWLDLGGRSRWKVNLGITVLAFTAHVEAWRRRHYPNLVQAYSVDLDKPGA